MYNYFENDFIDFSNDNNFRAQSIGQSINQSITNIFIIIFLMQKVLEAYFHANIVEHEETFVKVMVITNFFLKNCPNTFSVNSTAPSARNDSLTA